ncbi:MAG: thiamine ABC transporter substrate-binding protein [Microthrixaceae bacterium]|nr:thiamine ABC transporter substrate-binding protein [Microthrixaceae bacterium]
MTIRTRLLRRVALIASLLAAVASGAVACGDEQRRGASGRDDRTVVLVAYSGYALPEQAAAAFTKRTGWKIKVLDAGDAGTMLSAAILTAGRPEGDVLFGVDNTFLSRAQGSDAFAEHRPEALDRIPEAVRLDDTDRFIPIDTGTVCVNADQAWFAEHDIETPTDLASLAEPAYRDLLVVEHPATSSPGLAFLAATHATFGAGTEDYWRRLHDNGVAVSASWSDAYNTRYTVNGGDRPLVVSYASSPPAEVVYSEGARTEPASVVLERTCFEQVEFVALLAGAANPDGARLLMDEMLSEQWQAALPLSNFVYPVRPGTDLPEEFRKWAAPVADPIRLDPATIGRERDEWLVTWRDVME